MTAVLVSAKVSVFYSKFNKTFPMSSQQFYLEQTLSKHKNIGLSPNKHFSLNP